MKLFFLLDVANNNYFFQDEASVAMLLIVKLHHDIMFYLVLIFGFTLTVIGRILQNFSVSNFWLSSPSTLVLPRNFAAVTVLEVVWTFIPMIILFAIAYPSIATIYKIDTLLEPSVTIKVIGHQWYWSYETNDVVIFNDSTGDSLKQFVFDAYMIPVDDLNVGQFRLLDTTETLYIPVDLDVRFLVTATDVLHSWAIPSLGLKIDAIPGRLNQAVTNVFRTGIFYGQCSEICGVNHGFMPIKLAAVDFETYKLKTAVFA